MKLLDTIRLLHGQTSPGQPLPPSSRSEEEWIRRFLEEKEARLRGMQKRFLRVSAARTMNKDLVDQDVSKVADGGRWGVVDPEGLLISTHPTHKEARRAAMAKRYALVVDLEGPEEEYRGRFLLKKKPAPVQEAEAIRDRQKMPWKELWRRTTGGGTVGLDI